MTEVVAREAPPGTVADDRRPDAGVVAQVADRFSQLMRSFLRTRQAMVQAAADDVEWTSHLILRHLKNNGPMRAGALAECMQTDPSTVSRQVAAVVKEGLVERQADPEDGRASLLVLTTRADEVLERWEDLRNGMFADMVADWTADELRQFANLLDRFTASYQAKSTSWFTHKPAGPARQRSTAE